MRVLGASHLPVHNLAQMRVLHHWVTNRDRPFTAGDEPQLLRRQLARYQPHIAPEPGRGRCA